MEDILFTKEEKELIELMKYFRDLVQINEATPPYNKLILQEEIDYFNGEINTITEFAKSKTNYRKALEQAHDRKWNTKMNLVCPWCKTKMFDNPLGEIKLDDEFTYFQYYCRACKMNFESVEPNNLHDVILFKDKELAELSRPVKGGKTKQQMQGISFEQMRKKRDYVADLKAKEKKMIQENKEVEEANNEFMKYVLNELIRLNIAKDKFITENGLGD